MKKCLSIFLLAAMVLGMVACGGGSSDTPATGGETSTTVPSTPATEAIEAATTFSVGYARVDITPQAPVPLAGSTTARTSKYIRDNLYATAIAMTDGFGNTILLMTIDLQRASDITVYAVRPLISMQTGIPEDRIMIHGTHTHSGPDLNKTSNPAITAYVDFLNPRLLNVCLDALEDLKPAEMYIGSVETESLNFVKHYEHTAADGTKEFFGDHFGTQVIDETTKHATDADPTMHLLKFTRDGEKDIIIANWRAHPNSTASSMPEHISADFPGYFRLSMETQLDCQFAYFNGACGNLNSKSRITDEMRATDMVEHGYLLSQHAIEGLQNMTKIEPGVISSRQTVLDQPINHTMDHLYYKAKEMSSYFSATQDTTGAKAIGAPYGIRSTIHAGAIVSNYSRGETKDVELNAIAIGDSFAFVTAPNELFDTNSMYVEEHSPYTMTMTIGYANGYRGYIPSAYGWEYTCYESDCSWFLPGTGEQFQQVFLDMLGELKNAE